MPYMTWTEADAIGVPMFDDEHKSLVCIINDLHDGMVQGLEAEALRKIAADLVEFTFIHFQHEEMYFEDFHYPQAALHRAQHGAIKDKIIAYYDEITVAHRPELGLELLEFVRVWISSHIHSADKAFGLYLRERSLGQDGPQRDLRASDAQYG